MEAEGKCAEVSVEWFGKWLKGWEEDEEMIQERGSRKSEWRVRIVGETLRESEADKGGNVEQYWKMCRGRIAKRRRSRVRNIWNRLGRSHICAAQSETIPKAG